MYESKKYPMYCSMNVIVIFFIIIMCSSTSLVQVVGAGPTERSNLCESCHNASDCITSTTNASCDTYEGPNCYATWSNESGVITMKLKGCWNQDLSCTSVDTCVSHQPPLQDTFFCCCQGAMCNANISIDTIYPTTPPIGDGPEMTQHRDQLVRTLMYSLVPILAFSLVVVVGFWLWQRRQQAAPHIQLPTDEPSPDSPPSPIIGLRPVQLLEIKARGRFGCVWKAQMVNEEVAVKIFPQQDRQSWLKENDIYTLPQLNGHPNILRYIGAEKRGDNLNMDLWLITEFHERGSLYDYLKGHQVSWKELLKIAEGMARGLAYLHDDTPPTKTADRKPSVAHRDFKSKNVLLKADLTPCVGDLGLALKFEHGKSIGDAHGQVGTRRYMAPEVLEGAISFNRDSFLRIDMYACALVMWELALRCSTIEGIGGEYQLPFEEDIGLHPSLEDMQEVVVQQKGRPRIREAWLQHSGLAAFSETIEECWDHDPEARLSAGCVEERLLLLKQLLPTITTSTPLITSPPPINNNTSPRHHSPTN